MIVHADTVDDNLSSDDRFPTGPLMGAIYSHSGYEKPRKFVEHGCDFVDSF